MSFTPDRALRRTALQIVGAAIALGLVLGVFYLLSIAGIVGAATTDTEARRIADKLQCPVCQGTSVADSQSAVADSMRTEIRARLEQGQSERQIVDFFVGVYGVGVLREPPKTGWYSAVWWGPGVALALGAAIIYMAVRGRRKEGSPREQTQAVQAGAADEEKYRAELRREMEERER